ncbi:20S proteasome subunit alpha 3 [Nematocida sp. AWRm80]|nr:20S proteasome subunit alpha 3 [Nematocida sp. AWRm80]
MEDTENLTNTFSEEGRIHQVEYAIKSISSAGASIGVRFKNGVVLIGRSTDSAVLLVQDEKIYRVNRNTHAIVGGLYADSNLLVNYARIKAQEHLYDYDQDMSPWLVGKTICKLKQQFTQGGGMRPFGVSFMLAGYDIKNEYRLFSTDPSGTLVEWSAYGFGEGEKTILTTLEGSSVECTMEEALTLGFKALSATAEGAVSKPHAIMCTLLYFDGSMHRIQTLSKEEIEEYLEKTKAPPSTPTE